MGAISLYAFVRVACIFGGPEQSTVMDQAMWGVGFGFDPMVLARVNLKPLRELQSPATPTSPN